MSHNFRLRKASEVRVLTNKKVELAQKVIHAVSVLSIFAASAMVGIGFYEASLYDYFKDTQEDVFRQTERKETNRLDKFGGYKKKTAEARGYWYVTTIDKRNTIIDPLGNAFTADGVNKVGRAYYDDELYAVAYKGRHSQWAKEVSVFLTDTLRKNLIADRSEVDQFQKPFVQRMPYMVMGNFLPGEEAPREESTFPDPFSEEFRQKAKDESLRLAQLYGDDEYLMAVKISNEANVHARWQNGSSNGWDDWWWVLIDPAYGHTDAQEQWVLYMQERYQNDIALLNEVYETDPALTSFNELTALGPDLFNRFDDLTEEEEDDAEIAFADIVWWKARFYGTFHEVVAEELRAAIPNVLVGSDGLPNAILEDPIIAAAAKPVDFLILNNYVAYEAGVPDKAYVENHVNAGGKPILFGEYSFAADPCYVSDDGATYPHTPDQTTRAQALLKYRDAAARMPYALGVVWNGLVDAPIHDIEEGYECDYVNFGFHKRDTTVYQDFVDAGLAEGQGLNEIKWSPVLEPETGGEMYGPVDLNPIDPKKKKWFDLDPVIKTDTGKRLWYQVDPLNPNEEPPFTMPGPDVIEMMFGKSLEAPQ